MGFPFYTLIKELRYSKRVAMCVYGTIPFEEAEANVRLIAAAPKMLEVLKDMRDFLRHSGYDIRVVDATITKAEIKGDEK